MAVGFFRPHTPYVAPKEPHFGMYPRQRMPLIEGVKAGEADIPRAALESRKREEAAMSEDLRRECIQAYYASISFMDAQLGRVLDALDRNGLSENTVIVFTSDHGYHMGEHGLWQKKSLFEESSRVPLLVVAPDVTQPRQRVEAPASHLDLYPTLAELCGVAAPANLHGQRLVATLKDGAPGRGWALTQVTRRGEGGEPKFGYSLRTVRWRYTEWNEGGAGRELYDHDSDPRELTNLADRPEQRETVDELSAQLRLAVHDTSPRAGSACGCGTESGRLFCHGHDRPHEQGPRAADTGEFNPRGLVQRPSA